VDDGAIRALKNNKSLLPSGIKAVKGSFEKGAVVMINDSVKAVVSIGSSDLKKISGKHSSEIRDILGSGHRDVVAIPEDIVFLDY
jgi:glutamate 5-kinase